MLTELELEIQETEREIDGLLKYASGFRNFDGESVVKIARQAKLDEFGVICIDRNENIVYENVEVDSITEMEKLVSEAQTFGFQRSQSRGFPIFLSYGDITDAVKIVLTGRMDQPESQRFSTNSDKIWKMAEDKAYELKEMRRSAGIR